MSSTPIFATPTIAGTSSHSPALLTPAARKAIITTLWPSISQPQISIPEYQAFLSYFRATIDKLVFGQRPVVVNDFAAQTIEEVGSVLACVRVNRTETRDSVVKKLQIEFPNSSEEQINHSLELVSRLWLTVHITSTQYRIGPSESEVTPVQWDPSDSIVKSLADDFPKSDLVLTFREVRIESRFTIANFSEICGVQVAWTDNLRDHLRYDRLADLVWIYPHKICLVNHRREGIFCDDLLEETLLTLDLLFPPDKINGNFLEKHGQTFNRTHTKNAPRATYITEFHSWRNQITELHDVLMRPPSKAYQLWHDRRNPMQWWTFWLAALIVLLNIVFGVISSYVTFKQIALAEIANQLSEKSYRLSILQACMQNNSFCDLT